MIELHLLCPEGAVENLSDALMELEALSVSVEDADAQTPHEQALFGEPGMPAPAPGWIRSRVHALFEHEDQAHIAMQALTSTSGFEECEALGLVHVQDQDWVRLTQSQFQPVEITSEFWIVPTWHELPAGATKAIRLDPGLAFGTGTHPTTRMCLGWAATRDFTHERVMDYGCGSGILAIAAALFGATQVHAVDIDPLAVQSAQLNARDNHVEHMIQVGLPDMAQPPYDTVFANILATPLKVLAPLLCGLIKPGGHLVLAGILERQSSELIDAYAPFCQLTVSNSSEGWVLMTAQKNA
jgi:ribosomal protein L11 methyltransferase